MIRRALPVVALLLAGTPLAAQSTFIRADANIDGDVDISDAIEVLSVLFLGVPFPACRATLDANDDGKTDLTDAIFILGYLFTGGPIIPLPFPDCGPDPDAMGPDCPDYPHCGDACFDQAALEQLVARSVPPQVCVPADATQILAEGFLITVCPAARAQPCGLDGLPGCAVNFTRVTGTLDVPGREVRLQVEGSADAFAIRVTDPLFGSSSDCVIDIPFSGDAIVRFTAIDGPGGLELLTVDEIQLENVDVDVVKRDGGLLCDLLISQVDRIKPEIITQLEVAARSLLIDFNEQLMGTILCSP